MELYPQIVTWFQTEMTNVVRNRSAIQLALARAVMSNLTVHLTEIMHAMNRTLVGPKTIVLNFVDSVETVLQVNVNP